MVGRATTRRTGRRTRTRSWARCCASIPNRTTPEIVVSGVRNPWRFAFDTDGSLWIGDVGQNEIEEIDLLAPDEIDGANLGWSGYEGTEPYLDGEGRRPPDAIAPVFEYRHDGGNCSITGGFVYRGKAIEGSRAPTCSPTTAPARCAPSASTATGPSISNSTSASPSSTRCRSPRTPRASPTCSRRTATSSASSRRLDGTGAENEKSRRPEGRRLVSVRRRDQITRTFWASSPLRPGATSNSTFWPSSRDL